MTTYNTINIPEDGDTVQSTLYNKSIDGHYNSRQSSRGYIGRSLCTSVELSFI